MDDLILSCDSEVETGFPRVLHITRSSPHLRALTACCNCDYTRAASDLKLESQILLEERVYRLTLNLHHVSNCYDIVISDCVLEDTACRTTFDGSSLLSMFSDHSLSEQDSRSRFCLCGSTDLNQNGVNSWSLDYGVNFRIMGWNCIARLDLIGSNKWEPDSWYDQSQIVYTDGILPHKQEGSKRVHFPGLVHDDLLHVYAHTRSRSQLHSPCVSIGCIRVNDNDINGESSSIRYYSEYSDILWVHDADSSGAISGMTHPCLSLILHLLYVFADLLFTNLQRLRGVYFRLHDCIVDSRCLEFVEGLYYQYWIFIEYISKTVCHVQSVGPVFSEVLECSDFPLGLARFAEGLSELGLPSPRLALSRLPRPSWARLTCALRFGLFALRPLLSTLRSRHAEVPSASAHDDGFTLSSLSQPFNHPDTRQATQKHCACHSTPLGFTEYLVGTILLCLVSSSLFAHLIVC